MINLKLKAALKAFVVQKFLVETFMFDFKSFSTVDALTPQLNPVKHKTQTELNASNICCFIVSGVKES